MVHLKLPVIMLNEQYRMHPFIADFPTGEFYDKKLGNGVKAEDRELVKGFPWPGDRCVAFVNIIGREANFKTSKQNEQEATCIMKILHMLVETGSIAARDIGIITPYTGQVKLLKSKCEEIGVKSGDKFDSIQGLFYYAFYLLTVY
jgi:regulator of nonsense transcripts 1